MADPDTGREYLAIRGATVSTNNRKLNLPRLDEHLKVDDRFLVQNELFDLGNNGGVGRELVKKFKEIGKLTDTSRPQLVALKEELLRQIDNGPSPVPIAPKITTQPIVAPSAHAATAKGVDEIRKAIGGPEPGGTIRGDIISPIMQRRRKLLADLQTIGQETSDEAILKMIPENIKTKLRAALTMQDSKMAPQSASIVDAHIAGMIKDGVLKAKKLASGVEIRFEATPNELRELVGTASPIDTSRLKGLVGQTVNDEVFLGGLPPQVQALLDRGPGYIPEGGVEGGATMGRWGKAFWKTKSIFKDGKIVSRELIPGYQGSIRSMRSNTELLLRMGIDSGWFTREQVEGATPKQLGNLLTKSFGELRKLGEDPEIFRERLLEFGAIRRIFNPDSPNVYNSPRDELATAGFREIQGLFHNVATANPEDLVRLRGDMLRSNPVSKIKPYTTAKPTPIVVTPSDAYEVLQNRRQQTIEELSRVRRTIEALEKAPPNIHRAKPEMYTDALALLGEYEEHYDLLSQHYGAQRLLRADQLREVVTDITQNRDFTALSVRALGIDHVSISGHGGAQLSLNSIDLATDRPRIYKLAQQRLIDHLKLVQEHTLGIVGYHEDQMSQLAELDPAVHDLWLNRKEAEAAEMGVFALDTSEMGAATEEAAEWEARGQFTSIYDSESIAIGLDRRVVAAKRRVNELLSQRGEVERGGGTLEVRTGKVNAINREIQAAQFEINTLSAELKQVASGIHVTQRMPTAGNVHGKVMQSIADNPSATHTLVDPTTNMAYSVRFSEADVKTETVRINGGDPSKTATRKYKTIQKATATPVDIGTVLQPSGTTELRILDNEGRDVTTELISKVVRAQEKRDLVVEAATKVATTSTPEERASAFNTWRRANNVEAKTFDDWWTANTDRILRRAEKQIEHMGGDVENVAQSIVVEAYSAYHENPQAFFATISNPQQHRLDTIVSLGRKRYKESEAYAREAVETRTLTGEGLTTDVEGPLKVLLANKEAVLDIAYQNADITPPVGEYTPSLSDLLDTGRLISSSLEVADNTSSTDIIEMIGAHLLSKKEDEVSQSFLLDRRFDIRRRGAEVTYGDVRETLSGLIERQRERLLDAQISASASKLGSNRATANAEATLERLMAAHRYLVGATATTVSPIGGSLGIMELASSTTFKKSYVAPASLQHVLEAASEAGVLQDFKIAIDGEIYRADKLMTSSLPGRPHEIGRAASSTRGTTDSTGDDAIADIESGVESDHAPSANTAQAEVDYIYTLRKEGSTTRFGLNAGSRTQDITHNDISKMSVADTSILRATNVGAAEELGVYRVKYKDGRVGHVPGLTNPTSQLSLMDQVMAGKMDMHILDIETHGTGYGNVHDAAIQTIRMVNGQMQMIGGPHSFKGENAQQQALVFLQGQVNEGNQFAIGVWGPAADVPKLGGDSGLEALTLDLMGIERMMTGGYHSSSVEAASMKYNITKLAASRTHEAAQDVAQESGIFGAMTRALGSWDRPQVEALTPDDLIGQLVDTRRRGAIESLNIGGNNSGREWRIQAVRRASQVGDAGEVLRGQDLYHMVLEAVTTNNGEIVPVRGIENVVTRPADVVEFANIIQSMQFLPNDAAALETRQTAIAQTLVNRLIHRSLGAEVGSDASRPYGGLAQRHAAIQEWIDNPDALRTMRQMARLPNLVSAENLGHLDYFTKYVEHDPRMQRQWGALGSFIENQWEPLHQEFFDALSANTSLTQDQKAAVVRDRYQKLYGENGTLREMATPPVDPLGINLTPRAQSERLANLPSIKTSTEQTIYQDLVELGRRTVKDSEDVGATLQALDPNYFDPATRATIADLQGDWSTRGLKAVVGSDEKINPFLRRVGELAVENADKVQTGENETLKDIIRRTFTVGNRTPELKGKTIAEISHELFLWSQDPEIAAGLMKSGVESGAWFAGMGAATPEQIAKADPFTQAVKTSSPEFISRAEIMADKVRAAETPGVFTQAHRLGTIGSEILGMTPNEVASMFSPDDLVAGAKGKYLLSQVLGRAHSSATNTNIDPAQSRAIVRLLGWDQEEDPSKILIPLRRKDAEGNYKYSLMSAEKVLQQSEGDSLEARKIIGYSDYESPIIGELLNRHSRTTNPSGLFADIPEEPKKPRVLRTIPETTVVDPLNAEEYADAQIHGVRITNGANTAAAAAVPANSTVTQVALGAANNVGQAGIGPLHLSAWNGRIPPPKNPIALSLEGVERGNSVLAGVIAVGGILMMSGYIKKSTRQEEEDKMDRPAMMGERPVYTNPNITNINFKVNGTIRAVAPNEVDHEMIINSVHSAMEQFSNTSVRRTQSVRDARDPSIKAKRAQDLVASLI